MNAATVSSRVVAICFLVAVLEGFDIQALGVAGPAIGPAFGLTPGMMGWLFSISNIGIVIGSFVGGRGADIWGRRRVLMMSVLAFAMGTLGVSIADGYAGFFIARLLSGLGFGAALPNMMALSVEASPAARRARSAATIFCGMPLGGGSVAFLSQVLPVGSTWRTLFVIGGLLPVLIAVLIQRYLPETAAVERAKVEALPFRVALFADGRAVRTILLWLTFLPTLLILYLLLNWLPLLVTQKGFAKSVAPMASLVFNYASVVGALAIGPWVDRLGTRWIVTPCFLLLAVALYALSASTGYLTILTLIGAVGFTLMGANYSLYGVAALQYPQRGRGTGSGVAIGVGRFGSVLGPLMAGQLLGSGSGANAVIGWLIPGALLAAVAVFFLRSQPSD
jgi:MFS transporter, AAHS family, 3-hydroxyphenylpropionic acid transporter